MKDQIPIIHCAHTALVDIAALVPHPRNPHKHDDKQIALLAKIIRHQGWRAPITVSKRSGFIVAGHGRLEAAKLLQIEKVPVDYQNFGNEADEYAHLIADNRIAELADTDDELLEQLLAELNAGGLDMDLSGFDAAALEGVIKSLEETPAEAPEFKYNQQFGVIVVCKDEAEQESVYGELSGRGYNCKVVVT